MVLLRIAGRRYRSFTAALLVVVVSTSLASEKVDSLAVLYNNLGVVRALNEEFAQAKIYFDSALVLLGEDASVYNNLGNYHLCDGSVSESIEYYELSYALDSLDKKKLLNWSLALYLADSVEESVSKMQQFLDYASRHVAEEESVSWMVDEMLSLKGDAKKISKAGIKRLLDKAKAKQNKALEKKKANRLKKQQKKELPGEGKDNKLVKKKKKVSPAGEKSFEISGLAGLLYWVIL